MIRFPTILLIVCLTAACSTRGQPPSANLAALPGIGSLPMGASRIHNDQQLQEDFMVLKFHKSTGNLKDGLIFADKLISYIERTYGLTNSATKNQVITIADFYLEAAEYEKAEKLYMLQFQEFDLSKLPSAQRNNREAYASYKDFQKMNALITIYFKTDRVDLGEQMFEQAMSTYKTGYVRSFLMMNIGNLYVARGEFAKSERVLAEGIQLYWEFDKSGGVLSYVNVFTSFSSVNRSLQGYEDLNNNDPRFYFGKALQDLGYTYLKLQKYDKLYALYDNDIKKYGDATKKGNWVSNMAPLVSSFETFNLKVKLANYISESGNQHKAHAIFKALFPQYTEDGKAILQFFYYDKFMYNFARKRKFYVQSMLNNLLKYDHLEDDIVNDAFHIWEKTKGDLLDFQVQCNKLILRSNDQDLMRNVSELNQINAALSDEIIALDQRNISKLQGEKFKIQISISNKLKSLRPLNVSSQNDISLPQESIYLDFAKIYPDRTMGQSDSNPVYYCFLLTPNKRIRFQKIGTAKDIEFAVAQFHKAISKATNRGVYPSAREIDTLCGDLNQLILHPISEIITGVKHLIISPDAALWNVPLEILKGPSGQYTIERHSVSYIATLQGNSRDEVKSPTSRSYIFANPDYDDSLGHKIPYSSRLSAAGNIRSLNFAPLPETEKEAGNVAQSLEKLSSEKVQIYIGKDASEQNLLKVKSPKILHIASHGFFLPRSDSLRADEDTLSRIASEKILNDYPLMRSGIALAGANYSITNGYANGIVTAEKLSGLDLTGTDLVVLSACDTGSGDIQDGEGVLGLQRSIISTGAKKLVASFWPVPSEETINLMSGMYASIASGEEVSSSLRTAKLKMIKQNLSPFFWGAFTCISSSTN